MADIKKRHHYITKYYLENFSNKDGKIWRYEKIDPVHPKCSQSSGFCVEGGFYHLENSKNSINEIENYFSEKIEGPAAIPFKQLVGKKFPNASDRDKLSLFFGMQMVRTPAYLEHLNKQHSKWLENFAKFSASNKENFHKNYNKVHPNLHENEIEKDRQAILNGKLSFEVHKDFLLFIMCQLGAVNSLSLYNMKWALIETDENYPFITSDNFTNIFNPKFLPNGFYQPGLGMWDTRVNIPISNQLTLLMVNNDNFQDGLVYSVKTTIRQKSGEKINLKKLIKTLNKFTYLHSRKYVFANSDSEKLKTCFNNLLKQAKLSDKNKIEDQIENSGIDHDADNE